MTTLEDKITAAFATTAASTDVSRPPQLLRADADQWRNANLALPSDEPHVSAASRRWWPAAAAAAAVLVVGGGAVLAQGGGLATSTVAAGASVPAVTAPSAPAPGTAAPLPSPASASPVRHGPQPPPGTGTMPSGKETEGNELVDSRIQTLRGLMPAQLRALSDPHHPSTASRRSDGSMYMTLGATDGAVSVVTTWDRLTVPVSPTAVPGATSRTTSTDGTTVVVRDQPSTPEVLMVKTNGDSIDLSVTGDTANQFPTSRLASMAQQLLALQ